MKILLRVNLIFCLLVVPSSLMAQVPGLPGWCSSTHARYALMASEVCSEYFKGNPSAKIEVNRLNEASYSPISYFKDMLLSCLQGSGHGAAAMVTGPLSLAALGLRTNLEGTCHYAQKFKEYMRSGLVNLNVIDRASSYARNNAITCRSPDEILTELITTMIQALELEVRDFKCWPLQEQTKMLCAIATQALVPFLKDLKLSSALQSKFNASQNIINDLRVTIRTLIKNEEFRDLSLESKAAQLRRTVQDAFPSGRVIYQEGNTKIFKYIDSDGLESVKVRTQKPDGTWTDRDLQIDSTGFLSRSEVMNVVLDKVARAGDGMKTLVLVDVNTLGKVNYFPQGQVAGDLYLQRVASILQKHFDPQDLMVRVGGDEFMVVTNKLTPQQVQSKLQQISDEVVRDPQARSLFHAARVETASRVRDLNVKIKEANSLNDIPPLAFERVPDSLQQMRSQVANGQVPLDTLKRELQRYHSQALTGMSSYQPSISPGSTLIRPTDTIEAATSRASSQVSEVKAKYKTDSGDPEGAAKYGGRRSIDNPSRPNTRARPVVLPPSN